MMAFGAVDRFLRISLFSIGAVLIVIFFVSPIGQQNVFAQGTCTGTWNPYCGGGSGGCCYATKKVTVVQSCSWRNNSCRQNVGQDTARCTKDRSINCETNRYDIGKCSGNSQWTCSRSYSGNVGTCCGGSSPRPTKEGGDDPDPTSVPATPTPCPPTYAAPTGSLTAVDPEYPIVIGQDPDEQGLDIGLTFEGGPKTNSCPGPDYASITVISVDQVALSDEAAAWITGELARIYPGAKIKDNYPLLPSYSQSTGGRYGSAAFHLDALDPGTYEIEVTYTQSDGQSETQTFNVDVHLLESSITW